MLSIVRSEYCAVNIADVISGIAHIVALVQTSGFGAFSGRRPSENNMIKALLAIRVECLEINCSTFRR